MNVNSGDSLNEIWTDPLLINMQLLGPRGLFDVEQFISCVGNMTNMLVVNWYSNRSTLTKVCAHFCYGMHLLHIQKRNVLLYFVDDKLQSYQI